MPKDQLEAQIKEQAKAHKVEMALLKDKLEETKYNFELQNCKSEIVEDERNLLQKIINELRQTKEECSSTTAKCC
jgi:hypothetical protein